MTSTTTMTTATVNAEGFQSDLMTNPSQILAFMLAGNATITFQNVKSGTHLTYKIRMSELSDADIRQGKKPIHFVSLLTGADNEHDYTYIGIISPDKYKNNALSFRTTGKSKMTMDSKPCMVMARAFEFFVSGKMPFGLEVWHEGRCGRCGRKLTTPASVAAGFGPECLEMMGGVSGLLTFAVPAPEHSVQPSLFTPAPVQPPVSQKPTTPAAIVAAVNEDAEIAKLAAEMWAKSLVNPVNIAPKVAAEPLPVDEKVAIALAKSQDGWTIEDAKDALSKRRIVNLNLKPSTKIEEKVAALGIETPETPVFKGEYVPQTQNLDDIGEL